MRAPGSVRLRTTLAAVLVVAVALVVGVAALILTVRASLHDAAETTAEQRVADLVAQVETSGPPRATAGVEAGEEEDDDEDPEDVVWQVVGPGGQLVAADPSLRGRIPGGDDDVVELPGAEHRYVVAVDDADDGSVVTVAVSLEDVDETTTALAAPLLLGTPLMLLVVGATTWLVVSRALRPVERIRAEVELISGSSLERRVPEPPARDEVGRLARTMNQMLARLQGARDRQEEFVADASHELRSPLASIRQAAEVAHAHPGALPEGELADTVLEEALRMQALVDQLLALARAGDTRARSPWVDVDLDDLVLADARRIGRDDLAVDTRGVGPGRVRGDAVALAQVVRNLVDNAARHAGSRLALTLRTTDGAVVLTVEDDGLGVPEADRARVFERFVRLDDARTRDAGGSGLGLAIVREVVADHGGSVAVDRGELGGARFVVRLPS
ncbi:HAMP domain-containing sensor histidine kinase [Nocardioides sp. LHD-245]|uniref:sensor histidine kinase n=1 Tax=Nocardioides sp. LHD-245 TaxID=3051387 RepID=UPI0027DF092B|nr:HAMP domain-containing sensor histidine kinase [Nocardioides sp. LHD-245]